LDSNRGPDFTRGGSQGLRRGGGGFFVGDRGGITASRVDEHVLLSEIRDQIGDGAVELVMRGIVFVGERGNDLVERPRRLEQLPDASRRFVQEMDLSPPRVYDDRIFRQPLKGKVRVSSPRARHVQRHDVTFVMELNRVHRFARTSNIFAAFRCAATPVAQRETR
jgi:hypothetical protein